MGTYGWKPVKNWNGTTWNRWNTNWRGWENWIDWGASSCWTSTFSCFWLSSSFESDFLNREGIWNFRSSGHVVKISGKWFTRGDSTFGTKDEEFKLEGANPCCWTFCGGRSISLPSDIKRLVDAGASLGRSFIFGASTIFLAFRRKSEITIINSKFTF